MSLESNFWQYIAGKIRPFVGVDMNGKDITNVGKIGIGEVAPLDKLEVAGNALINGTLDSATFKDIRPGLSSGTYVINISHTLDKRIDRYKVASHYPGKIPFSIRIVGGQTDGAMFLEFIITGIYKFKVSDSSYSIEDVSYKLLDRYLYHSFSINSVTATSQNVISVSFDYSGSYNFGWMAYVYVYYGVLSHLNTAITADLSGEVTIPNLGGGGNRNVYADNAGMLKIRTAGWARAYQNSAQSVVTGTYTKVNLQAENYDIGGNFASSTFTAPVSGYYLSIGNVRFMNMNANEAVCAYLYKEGAVHTWSDNYNTIANGDPIASVSDTIYLAAGETIELYCAHWHGSNRNLEALSQSTFLAVSLLNEA